MYFAGSCTLTGELIYFTIAELPQEVEVKEQLAGKGHSPRRCLSSPSVHRLSGSRQELSANHETAVNKAALERHKNISMSQSSLKNASSHSELPNNPEPGLSGMASSYLSPVKALVTPVPKIFKTLLPKKEEKADSPPLAKPQNVPLIVIQCATPQDDVTTPKLLYFLYKPVNSTPIQQDNAVSSVPQPSSITVADVHPSPTSQSTAASHIVSINTPEDQTPPPKSQSKNPPDFVEVFPLVHSESEDLALCPGSDESSGYISTSVSTATLSDTLDLNLIPPSESEAQEAHNPSCTMDSEERADNDNDDDDDDKEVQLEPEKKAEHLRTRDKSQDNAITPDSKKTADIFQEKIQIPLSERSALTSSASESSADKKPSEEPKDHVTLAGKQPYCQPTSQKSSPSPSDPDLQNKSTSQAKISDALPVSKAPLVKQEQAPSNPFRIQKVKSSGLKSFKGILQEAEEEFDKMSMDPLEKLEILSDTEEVQEEGALPDWLKEDEYVSVGSNKNGTVRYIGPTEFAEGIWVGVELDVPAVGGRHYFHCNPGYGVLVRPDRVTRASGTAKRRRQKRSSQNLTGSNPNLAALTALAKGEGGPGARRGENRKSWNS
ncbi:Kinesin-like protein KIF13B [Bagarius yarrelli]|uniref:Kinesin-like protein KIF13B n=1 Tax=Bagarius yarrelli TaxID=175774 RepID=A0A556TT58_BAGYA|nr:Kinesin-like protein KIF13B [Bagarius yarrelli]